MVTCVEQQIELLLQQQHTEPHPEPQGELNEKIEQLKEKITDKKKSVKNTEEKIGTRIKTLEDIEFPTRFASYENQELENLQETEAWIYMQYKEIGQYIETFNHIRTLLKANETDAKMAIASSAALQAPSGLPNTAERDAGEGEGPAERVQSAIPEFREDTGVYETETERGGEEEGAARVRKQKTSERFDTMDELARLLYGDDALGEVSIDEDTARSSSEVSGAEESHAAAARVYKAGKQGGDADAGKKSEESEESKEPKDPPAKQLIDAFDALMKRSMFVYYAFHSEVIEYSMTFIRYHEEAAARAERIQILQKQLEKAEQDKKDLEKNTEDKDKTTKLYKDVLAKLDETISNYKKELEAARNA